jgi:hypothetical protein
MWNQPGADLLALVHETGRRKVTIDAMARLADP